MAAHKETRRTVVTAVIGSTICPSASKARKVN
jgi:hypothetical protein